MKVLVFEKKEKKLFDSIITDNQTNTQIVVLHFEKLIDLKFVVHDFAVHRIVKNIFF